MPFSPSDSQIFSPLFSEPQLAAIFSDEQYVRRLMEVEGALARAEGRLEIIPEQAGAAIAEKVSAGVTIDWEKLRAGVEQDGFPIIELVRQLRQAVGIEYGDWVHYGATTQDIMDTALVLQNRAALEVIEGLLGGTIRNLAALAERHKGTLMAGRTHSQQALPVTFGYKVAGWLTPLLRDRARLQEIKPRVLVVQLGGAAGTLAALRQRGDQGSPLTPAGRGRGIEVQEALAAELGLGLLPMPWHTQRDGLAELAGWLSLVSGSLAKMAQDIILLAQSEVGEVRESDDPARGGSSSMPQKSNPITSELIVAAARANAGHLAAMHQALIHEHERGTGAWQLEWLSLAQMFANTGSALKHALWLSENLQVDVERMRENVKESRGLMLAEALAQELAKTMERGEAKKLVSAAARVAVKEGRNLVVVVRERSGVEVQVEEEDYLGAAEEFVDRVVGLTTDFGNGFHG